jgi:uncharacterized protein YndB with AHSA1/START domain
MVDVLTEIAIDAPRERVAAYAADPSNAAAWFKHVEAVEWLTPQPLRLGSKFTLVARVPGRKLRFTYDVVEHVPGERLVIRTEQGPLAMETTYTWRDGDSGTVMAMHNRGRPRGPARLVAPVMVAGMRRANRGDMTRLKLILESQ